MTVWRQYATIYHQCICQRGGEGLVSHFISPTKMILCAISRWDPIRIFPLTRPLLLPQRHPIAIWQFRVFQSPGRARTAGICLPLGLCKGTVSGLWKSEYSNRSQEHTMCCGWSILNLYLDRSQKGNASQLEAVSHIPNWESYYHHVSILYQSTIQWLSSSPAKKPTSQVTIPWTLWSELQNSQRGSMACCSTRSNGGSRIWS